MKTLDTLQALQDACTSVYPSPNIQGPEGGTTPSILSLVHGITRCRLEISLDHTQINEVLGRLHQLTLLPSLVPTPPPTPRKRRSKRLVNSNNSKTTPPTTGVMNQHTPSCGMNWLEGVVMHVVGLGMPIYMQNQMLRLLNKIDNIVSGDINHIPSTLPYLSGKLYVSNFSFFLLWCICPRVRCCLWLLCWLS